MIGFTRCALAVGTRGWPRNGARACIVADTVMVTFVAAAPVTFTDGGTVQLTAAGEDVVQPSVTIPEKPSIPPMLSV